MIATGHRSGFVIIMAVILLVLSLIVVFFWVQGSRREPLPHAVPPARSELQRFQHFGRSAGVLAGCRVGILPAPRATEATGL